MSFNNKIIILFSVLQGFIAGLAFAQQQTEIGVNVSALTGPTFEAEYALTDSFSPKLAVGFGQLRRTGNFNSGLNQNRYDISLRPADVGFGFDYRLGDSNWDITTLFFNGGPHIVFIGKSGSFVINNRTFPGASVEGRIRAKNSIVPQITFARSVYFGNTESLGLKFEIGAMFTGGYRATLTETTPGRRLIPESDINAELAGLDRTLGLVTVLPIFKFGFLARF